LSLFLSWIVLFIQVPSMNFEEIYTKYYRKLFGFAYQYTLSKQDSEDLVHESFTRLWNEFQRGSEINNIQAWLYKVLINLIKTRKNRDRRWVEKIKQIETNETISEDSQGGYLLNEKKRIINDELRQLPINERSLLILYNRGFKYDEIAHILEIKTTSVGTTLSRTITKFRNTLKTKYNGLFE
jgi:RNA polymerase sigma factor (sigma-70 family)